MVNMGPVIHYPSFTGQPGPYTYQPLANIYKGPTMGASVISQSAVDKGLRTAIKRSRILNSVNISVVREPNNGKQKSGISVPEPGSSTPLGRLGSTSTSRHMYILYGCQAHVFDDVHPNKDGQVGFKIIIMCIFIFGCKAKCGFGGINHSNCPNDTLLNHLETEI